MLSKSAMNALLKILEEPPQYLVFLLATTNEEKLLPTVLSRLTKLHLFNHTTEDIVARLEQIAQAEKVTLTQSALKIIARHSGGSQRDAINLLETVASYELDSYDENNTSQLLGLLPTELLSQVANHLLTSGQLPPALLSQVEGKGLDGQGFLAQLLEFLLDRSLDGQKDLDALILPLAEVLDWQLPVTSPLAAIALVQAKLPDSSRSTVKKKPGAEAGLNSATPSQPAAPTNQAEPPKASTPNQPEPIQANSSTPPVQTINQPTEAGSTSHQNPSSASKENLAEPAPKPSETQGSSQTKETTSIQAATPEAVADFVFNLTHLPGAPAMLKMLAKDLRGTTLEGRLVLQSSTVTFQSALKSPSLQSWIKEQFAERFGHQPTIVLELYQPDTVKPAKEEANPPSKQSIPKPASTLSPSSAPLPAKTEEQGGVFYKVYNRLPKNMEDKGVSVLAGPLPGPQPKAEKGWDEQASELFEFE